MALFRRKPDPQTPRIRDPFAVIPAIPDWVDVRRDSRGMIHLRINATPKGLGGRIAGWLGQNYARIHELDEFGTYYFEQVDGKTNLHTIVDRMTVKLGTGRDKAEEAVKLFTKMLMSKQLIVLHVPESAQVRKDDDRA